MSLTDWRRKPAEAIGVDVVIPVLNEAHVLGRSVGTVHDYFSRHVSYQWRIVIAENGSTDGTLEVARSLAERYPRVSIVTLQERGRGRALRRSWSESEADVLCYTDVDLSTDLDGFPRLLGAVVRDGYDVAVGSRLLPQARTTRSVRRGIISWSYNRLLRMLLGVGFSDAQAGFKAVTREIVHRVLPLVQDQSWFLDTELLVLAEKLGYRIADIPITWVEDDDSRVRILQTAWDDLRGIARLRRTLGRGLPPEFLAARRIDHESAVH